MVPEAGRGCSADPRSGQDVGGSFRRRVEMSQCKEQGRLCPLEEFCVECKSVLVPL